MKRPLNLNAIAPRFLAWVAVFLFLVPALLYLLGRLLALLHLPALPAWLLRLPVGLGLVLLALFILLVLAEALQDWLYQKAYERRPKDEP